MVAGVMNRHALLALEDDRVSTNYWENKRTSVRTSLPPRYSKPDQYKHHTVISQKFAVIHPSFEAQTKKPRGRHVVALQNWLYSRQASETRRHARARAQAQSSQTTS